jgi:hypothetical protein
MTSPPSLDEFLAAPAEQVARVAPATVIYTQGGTRRSAALAGISPQSDDYARWSREHMITCAGLLFRLGTQHLFMTAISSNQLAEVGRYRERIVDWLDWGLARAEALEEWRRRGWRVRLVGSGSLPELQAIAERLCEATPPEWTHTMWWYVSSAPDAHWAELLAAAQRAQARTQKEAIRALYGEDIPPATLYLSFGKPLVTPDVVPLLMAGDMQCYWTQRPGYTLDERTLRHILYDYAYLRRTWSQDKSARYDNVIAQQSLWERSLVLGLGRRLAGFWYPALELDEYSDGVE